MCQVIPKSEGLIAAPYTPMRRDGALNLDVVPDLAALLARNGVKGVFVGGSTGEGPSLTLDERNALTEAWTACAPPSFRVLINVSDTSIQGARQLAAKAQECGAAGTGLVAPFYFRPGNLDALIDFFSRVAEVQPETPIYYYHIPELTGVDVDVATFIERCDVTVSNFTGVKYTSSDLYGYELARQAAGESYDLLYGRDEMLLCALAMGCQAAIGSTYGFAAPLYNRLIDAFRQGELEEARRLQRRSIALVRTLVGFPGSVLGSGKAIMGMLGVDCGPPRPPIGCPDAEEIAELEGALRRIAFFDDCCR